MYYSLQDYTDIVFSGYQYALPENVIHIISKLTTELGVIPQPQPTENYKNDRDSKYKKPAFANVGIRKNRFKKEQMEEQWETVKPFKATKIEKKEGIEKSINDIRICLNKISGKNYDTQRDAISQYITDIMEKINDSDESSDDEEVDKNKTSDLNSIANAIFDIASTNKFYSELYATLYKDLMAKFSFFQTNINGFINQYLVNIDQIQFVDQNVDYDKYCDNNKLNDRRKAMTAFIVNLMKKEIIKKEEVTSVILKLQTAILKYADEAGKTYEIEEITENIYIFITMSINELKGEESIMDNIKTCSQYKAKEHLSMTNRAIFKHMDILDFIKKNP